MTKRIRYFNKFLLFSSLLFSNFVGISQIDNTIHLGERFKVNAGTSIYFIGDYTDSAALPVTTYPSNALTNKGEVYFKSNLINKGENNVFGSKIQANGWAHFNPLSGNVSIQGDTLVHFHNLNLLLLAFHMYIHQDYSTDNFPHELNYFQINDYHQSH